MASSLVVLAFLGGGASGSGGRSKILEGLPQGNPPGHAGPVLPPGESRSLVDVESDLGRDHLRAAAGESDFAGRIEALSPSPQAQERILRGCVLDPDGLPVSRATVAVCRIEDGVPVGSGIKTRTGTGTGEFSLDLTGLSTGGDVLISARRPG
ncbi:MAG: carboxypeptidase-like regulatory domain-containing protein, partial [Planctomycetota bacterium]